MNLFAFTFLVDGTVTVAVFAKNIFEARLKASNVCGVTPAYSPCFELQLVNETSIPVPAEIPVVADNEPR